MPYGRVSMRPLGSPTGNYGVGCQRFWVQGKNHVVAFYPTDRQHFDEVVEKGRDDADNLCRLLPFYQFDLKKQHAADKITSAYWSGCDPKDVDEEFSYDEVRHDVICDMPVAGDLQVLTPMVFVHGFTGNNVGNVGLFREFASHGHIVFSVNTHDGTCEYTETEDGMELYFKPDISCSDEKAIRDCLRRRVDDVTLLIDELHKEAFLQ